MTAPARRGEGLSPLTPLCVVALFAVHGAILWAEGERLRFTGPMQLPPWLLAEASKMKGGLLELIRSRRPPPPSATDIEALACHLEAEALASHLEAEARSTPGVHLPDAGKARAWFEAEAIRLLSLARNRLEEQIAMPAAPEPPAATPAEAAAALKLQLEWGADEALCEQPVDRLRGAGGCPVPRPRRLPRRRSGCGPPSWRC